LIQIELSSIFYSEYFETSFALLILLNDYSIFRLDKKNNAKDAKDAKERKKYKYFYFIASFSVFSVKARLFSCF